MSVVIHKSDPAAARCAAECMLRGGIAILPTDTVYGFSGIALHADPEHDDIAQKIRAVKGRSEKKPFIKLLASPDDIARYTDEPLPPSVHARWPGALTVIVQNRAGGTDAFRCPGDSWLRAVIAQCGVPLYSTSVNKSGSPVLSRAADIIETFRNAVDLIVIAGDTGDALPSTIVSVVAGTVTVVRQGAVVL